jgi:hypothetical protein
MNGQVICISDHFQFDGYRFFIFMGFNFFSFFSFDPEPFVETVRPFFFRVFRKIVFWFYKEANVLISSHPAKIGVDGRLTVVLGVLQRFLPSTFQSPRTHNWHLVERSQLSARILFPLSKLSRRNNV